MARRWRQAESPLVESSRQMLEMTSGLCLGLSQSCSRRRPGSGPLASESQNHRMVGVGRDLCGSPSPTPLQKQGHPEQAA